MAKFGRIERPQVGISSFHSKQPTFASDRDPFIRMGIGSKTRSKMVQQAHNEIVIAPIHCLRIRSVPSIVVNPSRSLKVHWGMLALL
jgi:hypothetical protein